MAAPVVDWAPMRRDLQVGVLAAHEDGRVHLFLHRNNCIYQCLWSRPTCTCLQKMHVLRGLKAWHAKRADAPSLAMRTASAEDMWAWTSLLDLE